ncbi:MAG: hypothetical protein NTW21_36830 [Verrucomicrobia bacterium]|nr:hypothetical protein [Verrucomicrobiota bacterium]
MSPVLLGNTFPLTLIRRPVRIEPRPLDELRQAVAAQGCVSFWGHTNTLQAAREMLGFDPTPTTERPALTLNGDLLPSLNGMVFDEVWVLSPTYQTGYRPKPDQATPPELILNWQVLRVAFDCAHFTIPSP